MTIPSPLWKRKYMIWVSNNISTQLKYQKNSQYLTHPLVHHKPFIHMYYTLMLNPTFQFNCGNSMHSWKYLNALPDNLTFLNAPPDDSRILNVLLDDSNIFEAVIYELNDTLMEWALTSPVLVETLLYTSGIGEKLSNFWGQQCSEISEKNMLAKWKHFTCTS